MVASYTIEQIRALVEAGIALTSELSLEVILQKLVEIAHSQANSRYAALSVLDADDRIAQFATSGIGEAERARTGIFQRAMVSWQCCCARVRVCGWLI